MKRTYISGKISGLNFDEVCKKFGRAEQILKKAGYNPVNPCTLLHDHDKEYNSYIAEDIRHLLTCDAIYMLNDWKESKGSRIEHAVALELGLDIIYSDEWQIEHTVAKKVNKVEGFASLSEAKQLNNIQKSENAFVYDRFQAASMDCSGMDTAQVHAAFDEYIQKLPPLDGPIDESLFRLVPVDTFDTQEQIEYLIAQGHFYYAPEVGSLVKTNH
jgi:hypothetical protein